MTVEKNDIDISSLFRYGDKFEIDVKKGKKLSVYIRLVGDAELNQARVFALRKSAELRSKLKKEGSDERLAFIPVEYESIPKESLIEYVTGSFVPEITKEAIQEVIVPYPVEPDSDAPLENLEKYQKEVDEYPKRREEAVREYIKNSTDKKRNQLSKLSTDELAKIFENNMISQLCEEEMLNQFRQKCAYFGTYRDKNYTQKLFKSYEEFENLPPEVKNDIITFYLTLDLGIDELKK